MGSKQLSVFWCLSMRLISRLGFKCALVIVVIGCGAQTKDPRLNPDEAAKLRTWLKNNGLSPVEYVLSKFDDHDLVIIGEPHRFRDHPVLIQQLIPRLAERGVDVLATEFARSVDQQLIDSLLNAPVWDEKLARKIQLLQYSLWPWREYLDIYKVAWQYNQGLAPGQSRLRIIGINCDPDWSVIQTREDLGDPTKRKEAWKGCSEADWAAAVLNETKAGEKILAYCGMHHAFSRYRQPRVDEDGEFRGWGDIRFGNHLRDSLGERVFTIALHSPWYEKTSMYERFTLHPVEGAIDEVMETRIGARLPVGFDVVGSPFGELSDSNTIYAVGYDHFTLATFCDGYIYFRPFSESRLVTFIEGFYDEGNIDIARVSVPQPQYRHASPEYFESQMKRQLEREQERLVEF